MSRTILALLVFTLIGVGITLFFEQDNGYILMRYGDIVVETSMVFFAVALVLGLWVISLVWRSLRITLGLPRWLPEFYRGYRERSARRSLIRGLILLLEGRWSEAEKALAKRAHGTEARLVGFVNAAIAAQRQSANDRRDYYLQQAADDADGGPAIAVLLTQAELQLAADQSTQAIATLELLRDKQPDHKAALALLLKVCAQLDDWARVRELWSESERLNVLPADEQTRLGCEAYADLLNSASEKGLEHLDVAWQSLPRRLRQQRPLKTLYVRLLTRDVAGHPEALRQISAALKQSWQPEMALLYADIKSEDSVSQMAAVEGWIKQHGEQPELQLLAGQLCLQNKLWGRARSYLQNAVNHEPSARAWLALGQLNEQTGDIAAAAKAYTQGLNHAIQTQAER